jgi:hypothetical protein
MAHIIETPNAFQPLTGIRRHQVSGGVTINEWLRSMRPGDNADGWREFDVPVTIVFNGTDYQLRNYDQTTGRSPGWDRIIEDDDFVNMVCVPQGPFIIIALIIVVVAIAVTIAFSAMAPKTPGELPASDPVFSTRGQYNQIRLGEPIEVCYGRNRIYPSLAARPYFQYIDNDQFQYVLFCLGQGYYNIEQIQIGDTNISTYQEVTYEIIQPGGSVTIFPTNVVTSVEVGGQTLFGTNEAEYAPGVTDGWVGPFNSNGAGTLATELQIDVVFPKGIYSVDKKGNLIGISIGYQWQARPIDDLGNPLGPYVDLFAPSPHVITTATTTPQRRSYTAAVTPGRYQVRLRRTSSFDASYKTGNDVVWEGMRALIETTQNWGEVTLMAVKIRATNNLNQNSQQRFNVIAVRQLPIRNQISGVWSAATTTRSIMWAFVDVFRAKYGGRIFTDSYFDWDTFYALDALYASRNEYFDWCFRDPITVWEGSQAIGMVGRAIPLLSGSLVTIRRQGPLTVPVAMFTPDNMHKGTFKWSIKLWKADENDSISIEYTEPATGYKQEQVICVLPGGTTNNPKNVRLVGVQNRTHAYHQGMFILASEKYIREQVVFDTGLEGHIPFYGDLIAVTHDVPRWGQSGYVVNVEQGAGTEWLLWVSEPLFWNSSGESGYVVMLRGRKGELLGPFSATKTDSAKQVLINAPGVSDFLLAGDTDPMLFYFGPLGSTTKYMKIAKLEPSGDDSVGVTAVNDAPLVHSFDGLAAPALATVPVPPVPPDLPTILQVYITQLADVQTLVSVSWTAAFGALYYVVQSSEDNVTWTDRGTTVQTAIQLQVRPGSLWVRVAAVNNGQGPWATAATSIGVVSGVGQDEPWVDLEWQVSWFSVLNAVGYTAKVYDNTNPLVPVLKRTATLTSVQLNYLYNYAMATSDGNLHRNMKVTVDATFDDGPANLPASLILFNSIPLPPTSPASSLTGVDTTFHTIYHLTWGVPVEDDLITVKVWVSADPLFNASLTVPIYSFTAVAPGHTGIPTSTNIAYALDSNFAHPILYWRVALFDVWGNEIQTNITSVQTIPAYP